MAKAPEYLDPAIRNAITNAATSAATPTTAVVPGSAQDPFYHSTGQYKNVTLPDGTVVNALDVGSTKPPAATQIGMVSPSSGLTITGTERNMYNERQAMNIGYTAEYIASRGGINSQGYFNDTPLSGQLTANEMKSVMNPDGSVDTQKQADILIKKQYDEYIAQGLPVEYVLGQLKNQWGSFYSTTLLPEEAQGLTPVSLGLGSSGGTTPTGAGGSTTGITSTFGTGRTLAKDTFKKTIASFFGESEVTKPWVEELYNAVSKLYLSGSSAEEAFNIALLDARNNPNLKTFTDRFRGIYALQDMKQAGKPVIVPTIAEYVTSQAAMADILVRAGLPELANDSFTTDLISKGQSVSTVAENIAKVYNRIDSAPMAIKDTLSRYFPTVDRPTLAKTILLGEVGTKQLIDDLAKYEVLAAAEQQGIAATPERPSGLTVARAEEYAKLGETFGSIMPKLQRVAQATPIVSKLSGISRREDIGQAGIESAVIKGTAAELEELQRLSEEEEARFAGRAGIANVGLASQRRANRAF